MVSLLFIHSLFCIQVLLGRDEEMKAIDKYIRSEDKTTGLLALVGYPGAGKSSMMANCAKLYLNDPKLKVGA